MARLFRRADDSPKKSLWQRIKDVATADVGVILRGGVKEGSLEDLEEVLDRFVLHGQTTTSIIHSSPVTWRPMPV